MKIKYKITIGMICLLSLLFGIGGTVLINASFQSNLEREKEATANSYQMVMNTLQILDRSEGWDNVEQVVDEIGPLLEQDIPKWSGVRLSLNSMILYSRGTFDQERIERNSDNGIEEFSLSSYIDESGGHHLYLTGTYSVSGELLEIDVTRDISQIYSKRNDEIIFFKMIYIILVIICALLSLLFSWVLTKPLSKLSRAVKKIAAGDYSHRSDIRSGDEIGFLSKEFDDMADKTEKNILEMKASVERQERFMGNFTHEIKTPMAAIIGYSDMLRSQVLSGDEQLEAAAYIHSESKRLENLSLKMLDIFIAENKEITRSPANIKSEINKIIDSMRVYLDKKNIYIVTDCDNGIFSVDVDLFHSLAMNLLMNSVNAIEQNGRIEITFRIFPDKCILLVMDTGKGIPEEAISHITEEFYRVDMSRSRKYGGSGLGLSLCTRIANLHGGNISVESYVDRGTLVKVELMGGRYEQ